MQLVSSDVELQVEIVFSTYLHPQHKENNFGSMLPKNTCHLYCNINIFSLRVGGNMSCNQSH